MPLLKFLKRPIFIIPSKPYHQQAPKMATPIYSPSPRLERFEQAMQSVYGSFTFIPNPSQWTPPPNSGGHRGRYLWTDAYGVLNLLTMHREYMQAIGSGTHTDQVEKTRYLVLAQRLVETVHGVLGRTRDGKSWLPGASDENPVGGGLRIGKMDERGPDGDGQYHHYLTVWMFALNRLSIATGDARYNRHAIALAKAIHARFFVNRESSRPRLVWKMAMDLSAPLVASEGNLDPIDGYVVFRLLQAAEGEPVLSEEIADYQRVIERKGEHFVLSDPLDLGMTLWTAHWFSEEEDWAARLAGRCYEQICTSLHPSSLHLYSCLAVLMTIRRPLRDKPLPRTKRQTPSCLPRIRHLSGPAMPG